MSAGKYAVPSVCRIRTRSLQTPCSDEPNGDVSAQAPAADLRFRGSTSSTISFAFASVIQNCAYSDVALKREFDEEGRMN